MTLSLIVAADENNVIGGGNKLLWRLPGDMKHFQRITLGHPVIMGRKTFESIGHALPGRKNIVVTRQKNFQAKGCKVVSSLDEALRLVSPKENDEAFIIGGGEMYRLSLPRAQKVYFTRVHGTFMGDVTFPSLPESDWREVTREEYEADRENAYPCTFLVYERRDKTL